MPVFDATVGLATPLLLPVWLELSGLVLLTFGLSSPARLPEASAAKPKRKARKQKRAPRKPSGPSAAKPRATAPQLRLVAANQN